MCTVTVVCSEVTRGDCHPAPSAYLTCAPLSQPLIPPVHQRLRTRLRAEPRMGASLMERGVEGRGVGKGGWWWCGEGQRG